MQEVDSVIEKYINLINEIRRTNNQETLAEFDDLRESITKRIVEIEAFYEDNIHDMRITNFEKVRLRLKKLLMYDLETLNKIENTAEFYKGLNAGYRENDNANNSSNLNRTVNQLSTQKLEKTEQTPLKNIQNSNSQSFHGSQTARNNQPSSKSIKTNPQNDNSFVGENKNKSNQSNQLNQSNQTKSSNKNVSPNRGTSKKDEGNLSNYDLFNQAITKSGDEMNNKWREIVFKIKLTDKEYELLLKEKSKGLYV